MAPHFFEQPILNSRYAYPARHWELDADGQPTDRIVGAAAGCADHARAQAAQAAAEPRPGGDAVRQGRRTVIGRPGVQPYPDHQRDARLRRSVARDPQSGRLAGHAGHGLRHWRHHGFQGIRPFLCQVEAVETAIWLTEVAPKMGQRGAPFLEHLKNANAEANPELLRTLKLATGAGKTTVMAMRIA